MLLCHSAKARVTSMSDGGSFPVVLQETMPIVDPNSPRMPSMLPLSCVFDSILGNLNFIFLFPMGDVTITLTEASAGVVSTDDYSTASCFVAVQVPGPGTYSISVLLESGTEYTGQFVYN